MKKHSIGRYFAFALFGFLLIAFGLALALLQTNPEGIMKALPFVCIGIGCGVLGGNLGIAIKMYLLRKDSRAAKQIEIEERDERNIAIRNGAKARAYDISVIVFSAVLLILALLQVEPYILFILIAANLFIIFSHIYFIWKLNKEM
ncbi:MAG: hypothetical protein GX111_12090 [Clostridiales bacterium]|nr:hypothetical protein [Clostridiales bacterium]